MVDKGFFGKFVVDGGKFVVDGGKFVVDEVCKILEENVLWYGVKVSKKKVKIRVKEWSVCFLVYRGGLGGVLRVFFDRRNLGRMGESGKK